MLNSQNLINKICDKIACGGLTSLETCQTNYSLCFLETPVVSVSTFSNLPNAVTYAGRMVYVDDENRYYYAVNGYWLNKFDSQVYNYADEIWAWGINSFGQLGDNTTTNKSSPLSVLGGFTDWCQASANRNHSLAIRTDGTAWAWGYNRCGELGDNSGGTRRSSPVSVVGGFTDWCQASAGQYHSVALRTNGTLWAWGDNVAGKLGNNSSISRSSPVSVVGGFTDWCQVSAGAVHSLAVRTNGTLWAWGCNAAGNLGDNSITNRSSPVSVVGGFTDWCQASAGGCFHSLAVRTNGTLWAWGCNLSGRLGDNTTTNRSSPVSVVGGFTDWCQASAGCSHSLAVRTNGTLWAWGCNSFGQLGDNSTTSKSSPVSVVGGFSDWCQSSAGNCHSLAVRTNGTAWAWGNNGFGQLGDNLTTNRSSPVEVTCGFTDWCQVSAGSQHSLGVRQACKGF